MPRENSYNPEYGGLNVSHSGNWNRQDYHDHNKTHPNRLAEESEKRSPKPLIRERSKLDKPVPSTKIVDLATNKKTPVDSSLEKAHKNDLKNKGIQ